MNRGVSGLLLILGAAMISGIAPPVFATSLVSVCGDKRNERTAIAQVRIEDAQKAGLMRDFEKFGLSRGYRYTDSTKFGDKTPYQWWVLDADNGEDRAAFISLHIGDQPGNGLYTLTAYRCVSNKSWKPKADEFFKFVTSYPGVTIVTKMRETKGN